MLVQISALHIAAKAGKLRAVRFLIKRGASINALESSGWTALRLAKNHGWQIVAEKIFRKPWRTRHSGNAENGLAKNRTGQ